MEIANELKTYASFRKFIYESKDEHHIAQKDTQSSQTRSEEFIKTQLYALCCCFYAIGDIGEYNPI